MKIQIPGEARIARVDCGQEHSIFLDVSGRVYACGSNQKGQLGLGEIDQTQLNVISPTIVPNFTDCSKQVACGDYHTLIMSHSGLVYSCGENLAGQLGDGTRNQSNTLRLVDEISHIPMRFIAAGSFSAAISEDTQSLFLWGSGAFGEFLTPHRIKKIKGETLQVSIGDGFGMALTKAGNVYSWGENQCGQLGTGDNATKATPCLMQHLDTKRVTQLACGRNFIIALGQTLVNLPAQEERLPAREPLEQPRDSYTTISAGRWSRSQLRDTEDRPSPLRTKLRKKSATRSTGRLHNTHRDRNTVHGNRHVGGGCGHELPVKPRPPHTSRSPPRPKRKKNIVISPSRKHERMLAEREDDYVNYRKLVEERFT